LSALGWSIVIGLNGGIILLGLLKARETHSSVDWFLAARGLPWWIVGLSMFATAVDSGDYVAVTGSAYQQGLPYMSAWWVGMTAGWLAVAYVVFMPMYRAGLFTNSEYLEYRFGPVARVLSVIIQFQSRTNVLANVTFSLYLTFSVLSGWSDQTTWWFVVGIALGAAVYTSTGGLKSVVLTDALQAAVMLIASVVLWWSVWSAVGGWTGLESTLADYVESEKLEANVARAMTHIGSPADAEAPAVLIMIGWVIVMTGYCVINQSQAMRMLAARSVWDLRMAAVAAGTVTIIVMWFNVTLGTLGRAVIPDLQATDKIFPLLVDQFLVPLGGGLTGIVVAGLLAGGISTYDSVGSALAAIFTRDVYARFIVQRADDKHYVRVSRIMTFLAIGISFAYIPFIDGGMVSFYLKLAGVAVIPLLTVYLMGVLTRVHRASGSIGLFVGIGIGLTRFADPLVEAWFDTTLPVWWTNTWWGYVWSVLITALVMLGTSVVLGWAKAEEIKGLTFSRTDPGKVEIPKIAGLEGSWLEKSQRTVPEMPESPFLATAGGTPWYARSSLWTGLLIAAVVMLNFVLFW